MNQPNYRLIAVKVGNALKYDVTVNEVGRTAGALFRFSKEEFPNESITSLRAKLVHDWILTLAKQPMDGEVRSKLLVRFCQSITPEKFKPEVDQMLRDEGVLRGGLEDDTDFSGRRFHPEVFKHSRKLFVQRNYFHAVFESAKVYNKAVREKAKSNRDGEALMLDVWGWEKGVLKVTRCENETDRNVQDGVKFLSAGLMRAIRNPTAHEPAIDWPITKEDALDILSFISFLYRQLDRATYFKT